MHAVQQHQRTSYESNYYSVEICIAIDVDRIIYTIGSLGDKRSYEFLLNELSDSYETRLERTWLSPSLSQIMLIVFGSIGVVVIDIGIIATTISLCLFIIGAALYSYRRERVEWTKFSLRDGSPAFCFLASLGDPIEYLEFRNYIVSQIGKSKSVKP